VAGGSRSGSASAVRRLEDPRAIAVEVVRRVADERAYSNRLLPALLGRSGLQAGDRQLATELAYGTLRRMPGIDRALEPLLERPLAAAPAPARAALRVGAHQILNTRIPSHAAVSETVETVPRSQRGLVNAVLRRLAAAPPSPPPSGGGEETVAIRTGLNEWAVRELTRLLGSEEEAEAAAAALATPGALSLRTNACRIAREDLEDRLREAGLAPERGSLHEDTFRIAGGAPVSLPGFREGWFAVQDEASAYVVDVLDPQPGELVLDACAAPGGKAGDIACRSGSVVASDLSEPRARLIRRTGERLGVSVRLMVQDVARPALRDGFDRVLVDAPCSGIGAARRRPELLWRPDRRRLSALARLQVRLALGAASLLRPGGVFVYSVCTFPRAETDAVCDALESKVPWLRPDPFPGADGEETSRVRLWPHLHGTDAMFVARFVRAPGPAG
jgi:16S rRNA (cytosine967-C5)-methyltransferase